MRRDTGYVCIFLCCGCLVYFILEDNLKHRRNFVPRQEHLSILRNVRRIDTIEQPCEERRHVAFLKVHKAGSTTVMNILQRFGEKRSLICAIPKVGNYLGMDKTIQDRLLLKIPPGQSYNLLYNHVVYNRTAFGRVMPNNTVYVAIVREPLDLLDSAIKYLQNRERFKYLRTIPDNKLTNFLANPWKYEIKNKKSFTDNRMAYDFGLSPQLVRDRKATQSYLLSVSEDFDIVLLLEYFDESLILLKRKLCWSFGDIIYVKNNVNKAHNKMSFSKETRLAHRAWAIADNMFYDFFYEKFWKTIGQESLDFYKEVKEFKIVLQYVKTFCEKFNLNPVDSRFNLNPVDSRFNLNPVDSSLTLVVEKSDFSSEFKVSYNDCKLMKMPELDFMQLTLERHLKVFKQFN